jgi:four helix bundle protein
MAGLMNYQTWLEEVPKTISDDALWRMEVYRFALFVADLAWFDTRKLIQDRSLINLADQLYRATGSISANISEGYSRASGKDQARFYEYALGSARETRNWYFQSRHCLGQSVTEHRLELLASIIRQLLGIIPKHRGSSLKEDTLTYKAISLSELLNNVPIPD